MEPLLALLVLKPDGGKMLTLEGGAEERCRDLDTCLWRSRPTDLLVGPPYFMYEVLELSWMCLCKTQM